MAQWLGRLERAVERRTAAPLPARLRSRAPRFPPAPLERAIFRRGTFELAWSVPCYARFFYKYIPRGLAMLPEPVQATTRRKERARAREYGCWYGFRGLSVRRCCDQRPSAGSDAAGGGDSLTHVRFAVRDAQAATATPGPSRGHPIGATRAGISQELEVKLYAVLQLPGGDVSSG